MKILVCTDGSAHSRKALERAAMFAEGINIDEVAVIHVDEGSLDLTAYGRDGKTRSVAVLDSKSIDKRIIEDVEKREMILQEALKVFEEKHIKARTILKKGHPSSTIMSMAAEEGFDVIIIGSRGLSGMQKMFLGSVSNAIVQEAKNCTVIVVK